MDEKPVGVLIRARAIQRHRLGRGVLGAAVGVALALLSACAPAAPPSPTAAPAKPAAEPAAAKPAATTAPAAKKALEKLIFTFDFTLYGGHAPYFLARERGYFADQRLEVEFIEGTGSANTAKIVGAGASPMGRVDGAVVIRSIAEGVPIKAVAGTIQQSPLSILVPRSSGMKAPKDLEGKKLAGTPGGAGEVLFPAWLKLNGVDPDKVQIVQVSVQARNAVMLAGSTDGMFGFAHANGPQLRAGGLDVVPIMFADYGFNVPSITVVANATFLRDKPQLVRAFLAATVKGLADTEKDPKAAIAALVKHAPPTFNSEVESNVLVEELKLLHTKRTQDKPIGWMAREDWEEAINLLAEHAGLSPKPRVGDATTNEFLPGS